MASSSLDHDAITQSPVDAEVGSSSLHTAMTQSRRAPLIGKWACPLSKEEPEFLPAVSGFYTEGFLHGTEVTQ
ncbi:hypothetical protein NQZ68_021922 [Dissostichus eleginoides]|nr:hypothetical protein NQZ68_021922 [Dissostichus eleginoides]